jgi:hypothetical protein
MYYYFYNDSLKENLFGFDFITSKEFCFTLKIFLKMIIFFCTGNILYKLLYSKYRILIRKKIELNKIFISINPNKIRLLICILLSISILFTIGIYGEKFFYRDRYIPFLTPNERQILSIIFILTLFSSLLSTFIIKRYNIFSIIVNLTVCLLFVGRGSRWALLCFLLIGVGCYLIQRKKTEKIFFSIIFIFILFIFAGFNISLRDNVEHGLIPYLSNFNWTETLKGGMFSIYYTLIFGFFLTHATFITISPQISDMLIFFNPLPGNIVGWYEIQPYTQLNPFAPGNAIGTLALFPVIFAIYFILLGLVFSIIDRNILKCLNRQKFIIAIIIWIIIIMTIPMSFEYTLRATTRYVYYVLFILIINRASVFLLKH